MKNIFGLGLRPPFYKEAAAGEIAVDWFEVITENFMVDGGNPLRVSDHLCWTRHGGHHLHDLLPLPYRKDVIEHVARRISQVQDRLGCQILIENVSSYAECANK